MANDDLSAGTTDQIDQRRSGRRLALPVAAWGFAFLVLRLFAVARYRWDEAFQISTTLSVDDGVLILAGSLFANHTVTSILLICVLPLLLLSTLWPTQQRRPGIVLTTAACVAALVALTLSDRVWWLPAAAAAGFAGLVMLRRLSNTSLPRRILTGMNRRVGLLGAIGVLCVAAVVQTPWTPREEITTKQQTFSGYVLSVDSGFVNVLTAKQHQFRIIPSSEVISRH